MSIKFDFFTQPLQLLLDRTLKSSRIEFLKDLLSPSFFAAVPASDLIGASRRIFLDQPNGSQRLAMLADLNHWLKHCYLQAHNERPAGATSPDLNEEQLFVARTKLVEIYFIQVLYAKSVFLDLRRSTITSDSEQKQWWWVPGAFCWTWSPAFQSSMQDIYLGFYLNQSERFSKGLASLNLGHAEELFRAHFGTDTTKVEFKYDDFIGIFTKVFASCVKHKVQLHPEFMPLGIMLTFLYQALHGSDRTFDVASIFNQIAALEK